MITLESGMSERGRTPWFFLPDARLARRVLTASLARSRSRGLRYLHERPTAEQATALSRLLEDHLVTQGRDEGEIDPRSVADSLLEKHLDVNREDVVREFGNAVVAWAGALKGTRQAAWGSVTPVGGGRLRIEAPRQDIFHSLVPVSPNKSVRRSSQGNRIATRPQRQSRVERPEEKDEA